MNSNDHGLEEVITSYKCSEVMAVSTEGMAHPDVALEVVCVEHQCPDAVLYAEKTEGVMLIREIVCKECCIFLGKLTYI